MTPMMPLPGRKTTDVVLAKNLLINTNAGPNQAGGNVAYVGPILSYGSAIEDLVAHVRTHSSTDAAARWTVVGEWSSDLELWTEFTNNLMAVQSTVGQSNQTPHNGRADYGIYVRFKLVAWNNTGGSQNSVVVTVIVSVRVAT